MENSNAVALTWADRLLPLCVVGCYLHQVLLHLQDAYGKRWLWIGDSKQLDSNETLNETYLTLQFLDFGFSAAF